MAAPIVSNSTRNPSMVSAEQVFMAENLGKQTQTVTPMNTQDTIASESGSKVSHTTDDRVRMWKPTAAGYRPRMVPTGLIMLNLKQGWKTACPDCGRDCGDNPNDCPAFDPSPVAYCPKAGCDHSINLRNLGLELDVSSRAEKDPNAVDLGYGAGDGLAMLKAAMDAHIITRHPREARILLGVRDDRESQLVANDF